MGGGAGARGDCLLGIGDRLLPLSGGHPRHARFNSEFFNHRSRRSTQIQSTPCRVSFVPSCLCGETGLEIVDRTGVLPRRHGDTEVDRFNRRERRDWRRGGRSLIAYRLSLNRHRGRQEVDPRSRRNSSVCSVQPPVNSVPHRSGRALRQPDHQRAHIRSMRAPT